MTETLKVVKQILFVTIMTLSSSAYGQKSHETILSSKDLKFYLQSFFDSAFDVYHYDDFYSEQNFNKDSIGKRQFYEIYYTHKKLTAKITKAIEEGNTFVIVNSKNKTLYKGLWGDETFGYFSMEPMKDGILDLNKENEREKTGVGIFDFPMNEKDSYFIDEDGNILVEIITNKSTGGIAYRYFNKLGRIIKTENFDKDFNLISTERY